MAIPDRTSNPLCHFLTSGANCWVVPLNSEAKDALDAFFSSYGSNTTVAITQEDAGRGGYAQTGEDSKALKFATS